MDRDVQQFASRATLSYSGPLPSAVTDSRHSRNGTWTAMYNKLRHVQCFPIDMTYLENPGVFAGFAAWIHTSDLRHLKKSRVTDVFGTLPYRPLPMRSRMSCFFRT